MTSGQAAITRGARFATVTEIYDYLRLLYARLGEAVCPQCGKPVRQQTPEQILEELLALPDGTRLIVLAPMVRGRKGRHKDVFDAIAAAGFVRARVDGAIVDIQEVPELVPQRVHHIEAVVDRIVVRDGVRKRLSESIQLAIRHGDGLVLASYEQKPGDRGRWDDELFSTRYACPDCKIGFHELEPRTFSFNSPYGACPRCEGLGVLVGFDPELVVPDAELSLADGAVSPWKGLGKSKEGKLRAAMEGFLAAPWTRLGPTARYVPPGAVAAAIAWQWQSVCRRVQHAGKGIRHHDEPDEGGSAWKPAVAKSSAPSATARVCDRKRGRCRLAGRRFTR